MRYFLFSWRWALNCCRFLSLSVHGFWLFGPKPHSAPCSLWLIRPRLHALGLAMASPHGCGCQANRQLSFFWILQAQRLGHGYRSSHGGLAAKLEDERESFLALVSKTRTKLLKAFPLHEVPDRVENCRNAFFWMRQHLHGTGVAKCLQDLEIALDILTAINLTDLDAAPDRRIVTGLPLRMQGVKCGLTNNTKQEFLHAEELMALFVQVSQAGVHLDMGTWFDFFSWQCTKAVWMLIFALGNFMWTLASRTSAAPAEFGSPILAEA